MGFIGDIFGGGGSSQTVVQQANLTPEQIELINRQVQLADIQIREISRQRRAQERAFGSAESAARRVERSVAAEGDRALVSDEFTDELVALQQERLRSGGEATPREVELINEAVERALAAGEADIERFQSQSTEQLREELAPQLGLRPGDTPILDRGARIAAEAGRQQGQLVNTLRGQQASSLLTLPLARTEVLGGLTQQGLGLAEAARQFQSQLQQSAFTNRLQLAGAQSTAGLGLAGVATPNIGPAFSGLGSTQTISGSSSAGFGEVAGGIGGLLLGLGAVI